MSEHKKKIVSKGFNNYRVSVNTLSKQSNNAVSLIINSWFTPSVENVNYIKEINKLNKLIKNITYRKINKNIFKCDVIVDLDIKKHRVKYNKKSYMSCEIILFKSDNFKPIDISDRYVFTNINNLVREITNSIDLNEVFDFTKRK